MEPWRIFFGRYWKLIYAMGLKAGMTEHQANDLVKEVVISSAVACTVSEPGTPSRAVKAWLFQTICRQTVGQGRDAGAKDDNLNGGAQDRVTLAEVARSNRIDLQSTFDLEWKMNLMDMALERVKARSGRRLYQAFHLRVIRRMSPRDVAASLRIPVASVYLAGLRLSGQVRKTYRELDRRAA